MVIGLYRGHFDPIHIGRIDVARKLKSKYRLDKLVFVPIFKSPDPKRKLTDGLHRVEIIKKSVTPFAEVSDFEVLSEGNATPLDTVRYFHFMYPEANLVFFLDARSLEDFDKWEDKEEFQKYCEIALFQTSTEITHKHIATKYRMNSNANILNDAKSVSSIDYKKGNLQLIMPKAQDYIGENFLYIDDFLSGLYNPKDLSMAYASARLALEIAKNNGVSKKKTYYATLLRGVGVKSNFTTQLKYLEKFSKNLHLLNGDNIDGPFGSKWLEIEYRVVDQDVLRAIHNHTLMPNESFTKLDKIVYVVNLLWDPNLVGLQSFSQHLINDFEKGLKKMLRFVEIYHLKHKIKNRELVDKIKKLI